MSTDTAPRRGKTTIAPEVLLTIARLAALAVPGVARMSHIPSNPNRLFKRSSSSDGVQIEVRNDTVALDLYLIIASGHNVREISRHVQMEVTRAIQDMVGMEVLGVNIHIEDIAYAAAPHPAESAP